ncbi:DNA mismatch repair protein MutL [Zhongshania aliphaticivorans]|uniref:DNA mismatch repair protein MutL n=1 Tax=Zhongshania aliphaticivorans TaxID=1470434 RepID=A0A5S9MU62_9GAMM|nr:ATP-binding protein [Zhongshania aliphaticivorans]CAA0078970.1 DNA mismatch repair protein MutL [Zhongshania aliphaticivorans]
MKKIAFQVDTRLAKLLSENYRSTERALKELVDNAWDADAPSVNVFLPEPMTDNPITVYDSGCGMTEQELLREYLFIASDRRKRRGELTAVKKRKVKGKKGIGKFAGLMIANSMRLETWSRGKKCEFSISTKDFENATDIEDLPINLIVEDCDQDTQGTKITLSDLIHGLAFPNPEKMRQQLLQEYGREEDFDVMVNDKALGIDDIQGNYTEHKAELPSAGSVNLEFTVSSQKGKLKQPGISIRVGGKTVGSPDFFGLDQEDDFPPKLLEKIYGEVEVDGLFDHVTADWGALVENSELYQEVADYIRPIIKDKVKEEYGREMNLAQARLKKRINERLAELPEYKRQYADKAIKSILGRYYGEPESKVEPIVGVLLDALERTDYRAVLDYIHDAQHSDIAKLAEALTEFGLAELAIVAEQAKSRLEFLDRFEELCKRDDTEESVVHTALEKCLWIFGISYSVFSSNKTLKRQVEDYLEKKYTGKRANKRPDLLLNANFANEYLLIEFKRPSHSLRHKDYQQATAYRNDFVPYTNSEMKVLLVGGKRGQDLPPHYNKEPNSEVVIFDEIISNARNQLNWLLVELGGEAHA